MEETEMRRRVAEARTGYLATVTSEGHPHVVVCCFALVGDRIYSAVDAKPKSTGALRRLVNIRSNPMVTFLVDHYDDDDWSQLWWVRVDGRARVVAEGPDRDTALRGLASKYRQYRETAPPGPVIVVEPLTWRGWRASPSPTPHRRVVPRAVLRPMERVPYDEFSLFHENAAEFGLPYEGPPAVRRVAVDVGDGRQLSALVWGTDEPELVLLHGGGQNAHTWDTVALALGRALVAIDLPGHGHSDGPRDEAQSMHDNADDVAAAIRALAPAARAIVGMSAGGLTALGICARAPELVRKLVLVDILPNPDPVMAKRITDFVAGPETFESFDDILARTVAFNPTRSESSLRRGILHNAAELDDGTWQWRHRRHRRPTASTPPSPEESAARMAALWDVVGGVALPMMLVRGMADGSVITDTQEEELRRRVPSARIEHVEDAGHSVQGDKPVELASLLADFVF